MTKGRLADVAAAAILLLAALVPYFANLDATLWQDEAQTALVARTVVERGLPYGSDGLNFFSQELGSEYGDGTLWRWHTWLQFYVVAASFLAFGDGAAPARLPFALFGALCVPALYAFVRASARDRRAALIAALLLLGCVWFALLARQCRYYSATALFSLLALHGVQRLLDGKRGGGAWFAGATVLLFHAHYAYAGALLAAVTLHAVLLRRDRLRAVLAWCAVAAALCLPWIVWLGGMRYAERYGERVFDPALSMQRLASFGEQIHAFVAPAWLLALVPLAWFSRRRARGGRGAHLAPWRAAALPLIFVAVTVASLSLVVPGPFFRYLAPVIPPLLGAAGILLATIARAPRRRWLGEGAAAAAVLVLLSRQPLRPFAHELLHETPGPVSALIDFLRANARPGDVVAITYGDLPLKFHLADLRLRIAGGLTGEDLEPAARARFVVARKNVISPKELPVWRFLAERIDLRDYRTVALPVPDLPFENREDPREHRFFAPEPGSHPPLEVHVRIDGPPR